uniref:PUM-HD domain-containing protein n=1 Tax=Arion vulgaris TaxID=1028688 RepID=A0A0B7B6B3_9EUPU
MKNKSNSPALKRQQPNIGKIRQGGFGITNSKATRRLPKDVSMTPDTFERSQSRVKKTAVRRRKSLYDGDATTQVIGNETQLSQDEADSALDHTPVTLSQISAIDPSEDDTLITFKKKKNKKLNKSSDATLEMAVHYARGEPDGAERSFTRKQLSKISLGDSDDDGNNDVSMEGIEEEDLENDDEFESASPRKKTKIATKDTKSMAKKAGKVSLKIPFKQAAKKLKSLKSAVEIKKTKKKINTNFEALPDETTVPKVTSQTFKEKKQQRKMLKNNFDLIASAKKAWEELRRADLPEAKRKKICDDLMKIVVGKVKELSVVHDSARVVQCIVQYGSEQQREAIFEEVKSDVCELCKLKYAKYVVRKLIHYGSKS